MSCRHLINAETYAMRLLLAQLSRDRNAYDLTVGELNHCTDCLMFVLDKAVEFGAGDRIGLFNDERDPYDPQSRVQAVESIEWLIGVTLSLRAAVDEQ